MSKYDYKIYHPSYSQSVGEMLDFVARNGYEISEDEVFHNITTGPGRPKPGQTTRHSLILSKDGNATRRMLQAQVYGLDGSSNQYELNQYIS